MRCRFSLGTAAGACLDAAFSGKTRAGGASGQAQPASGRASLQRHSDPASAAGRQQCAAQYSGRRAGYPPHPFCGGQYRRFYPSNPGVRAAGRGHQNRSWRPAGCGHHAVLYVHDAWVLAVSPYPAGTGGDTAE
ncbi:Hypothetical protein GbCGDNIH4_7056 [Granulibacter bethesdensis CGDNIH4]|nr:Hypothetical protein GbCGDNIH4_7056 [Granulibacter bethesdensis CGDNIH4]